LFLQKLSASVFIVPEKQRRTAMSRACGEQGYTSSELSNGFVVLAELESLVTKSATRQIGRFAYFVRELSEELVCDLECMGVDVLQVPLEISPHAHQTRIPCLLVNLSGLTVMG
jgi:hypothetical protein